MGYWRDAFEHFLESGWVDDLGPLLVVAEDSSKLLSDRAEAAAVIYRNGWRDSSRDWAAIAQRALSKLSGGRNLSVRERTDLIPILRRSALSELAQQHIEKLVSLCDPSAEERRTIAKLLSASGDTGRAKTILKGIPESEEAKGWFGPWDDDVIGSLRGKEQLKRIEAHRVFNDYDLVIDRLIGARDLVSKYGDKEALQLIWSTAHDTAADPNDRLEAIEVLDDLGYRNASRDLLPEIIADPRMDDFWAGDLLLRFGSKGEALKYLCKAIWSSPKDYRDQIARRLADLQAIDLLDELDNRMGALYTGETDEGSREPSSPAS